MGMPSHFQHYLLPQMWLQVAVPFSPDQSCIPVKPSFLKRGDSTCFSYIWLCNKPPQNLVAYTTVYYLLWFCRLARWFISWFHPGSLIKRHSAGRLAGLEDPRWPDIMCPLVMANSQTASVFLIEFLSSTGQASRPCSISMQDLWRPWFQNSHSIAFIRFFWVGPGSHLFKR